MNSTNNSIIGLHVGSRVFYCHRSTLANAEIGSYFERRFGSSRNFSDDDAYTDQNGMKIFFIERDGDLFAHILKYLTRLTLNLPPYRESKALWRDLRLEAEFFSLDGLTDILSATHTCPYNAEAQGIFYWLGVGRGTKNDPGYVNPLKIRGRGDNRETSVMEISVGFLEKKSNFFQDHSDTKTSFNLIQHRKKIDLNSRNLNPIGGNTALWRKLAPPPFPIPLGMAVPDPTQSLAPRVFKFGSILVRPTHVSIRVPYTKLVVVHSPVNLEASFNGAAWERLRLEPIPLQITSTEDIEEVSNEIASVFSDPKAPMLQSMNRLIDVAETYLRRTWTVEPVTRDYYKLFRFVAPDGGFHDLAGVGLEVFGDVQEE